MFSLYGGLLQERGHEIASRDGAALGTSRLQSKNLILPFPQNFIDINAALGSGKYSLGHAQQAPLSGLLAHQGNVMPDVVNGGLAIHEPFEQLYGAGAAVAASLHQLVTDVDNVNRLSALSKLEHGGVSMPVLVLQQILGLQQGRCLVNRLRLEKKSREKRDYRVGRHSFPAFARIWESRSRCCRLKASPSVTTGGPVRGICAGLRQFPSSNQNRLMSAPRSRAARARRSIKSVATASVVASSSAKRRIESATIGRRIEVRTTRSFSNRLDAYWRPFRPSDDFSEFASFLFLEPRGSEGRGFGNLPRGKIGICPSASAPIDAELRRPRAGSAFISS